MGLNLVFVLAFFEHIVRIIATVSDYIRIIAAVHTGKFTRQFRYHARKSSYVQPFACTDAVNNTPVHRVNFAKFFMNTSFLNCAYREMFDENQ